MRTVYLFFNIKGSDPNECFLINCQNKKSFDISNRIDPRHLCCFSVFSFQGDFLPDHIFQYCWNSFLFLCQKNKHRKIQQKSDLIIIKGQTACPEAKHTRKENFNVTDIVLTKIQKGDLQKNYNIDFIKILSVPTSKKHLRNNSAEFTESLNWRKYKNRTCD